MLSWLHVLRLSGTRSAVSRSPIRLVRGSGSGRESGREARRNGPRKSPMSGRSLARAASGIVLVRARRLSWDDRYPCETAWKKPSYSFHLCCCCSSSHYCCRRRILKSYGSKPIDVAVLPRSTMRLMCRCCHRRALRWGRTTRSWELCMNTVVVRCHICDKWVSPRRT